MNSDSEPTIGPPATPVPATLSEPASDEITSLALRRLIQITTTLELEANHFGREWAEAERALDGGHDQILADQHLQLTEALRQFVDPLVRARAVEFFVALASSHAASAVE